MGLDLILLNFPLGCGPGGGSPWQGGVSFAGRGLPGREKGVSLTGGLPGGLWGSPWQGGSPEGLTGRRSTWQGGLSGRGSP